MAGPRLKWAQHSNGSQTARMHTSWGVAWFFEIRNGVLAAWSEGRVVETAEGRDAELKSIAEGMALSSSRNL